MPTDATTDSKTVATTCPYCGVGCGVLATVSQGEQTVSITGDPDHPANSGRLCSKGSALNETLALDERLLVPSINGQQSDWSSTLSHVANELKQYIERDGPDSVAFYLSGQLLTEDYYVANKLMKGFIGTANVDTNSRLCMASSVAGHKRAFGSDTVPGCYEDLELADLVVLVGSNLAWCHPVLYQRIVAAKQIRPQLKVVVIDPRQTATCDIADMHLALAPGTDVALFNGLLAHLENNGCRNGVYVENHTSGIEAALEVANRYTIAHVARITELSEHIVGQFYKLFLEKERTVTVYSQGVNQSSSGTDKVNSVINCHLLTGRIGKPGMGPFSITGQPNAMGGREVGGLSNQLASHMDLDNPTHREELKSFWNAPTIASKPGLKAVDMFRAVAEGRIKAIWIMATNPIDSLPQADDVREALRSCPFVVVSDVVQKTDTTQYADVLLPALAWGEKDGTVTNSERRISRQRSFLPVPDKAKPDWWIISQVAKRMGFSEGFSYAGPSDIFDEYARSTLLANRTERALDLSGVTGLDTRSYDAMQPIMWPVSKNNIGSPLTRFFADGGFHTPDQKARFVTTSFLPPQTSCSDTYPMSLNTGRIRDQWHTMTRTAMTPRLMGHLGEPFAELHPDDAKTLGIDSASLVEIRSEHGNVVVRALITDRQRKGSVFVPMHWTDQYASNARIGSVVSSITCPISGQPESKYTPVNVKPWAAIWYGFAILADKPEELSMGYWAQARTEEGWCLEMADAAPEPDWQSFATAMFQGRQSSSDNDGDLLSYFDRTKHQFRFVMFAGERLLGAIYIAKEPVSVARAWAGDLLKQKFENPEDRLRLLAARPGADQPDRGAIVCSCFSVGANQIARAVCSQKCATVDDIGNALQAGTNCGSCRPEIRKIINETSPIRAE